MQTTGSAAAACLVVALALGCGAETDGDEETATQQVDEEAVPRTVSADERALRDLVNEPWTGDLDGMVERGFVRLLTAYNPVNFTYDGVEQRGIAVEAARIFEERLNEAVGMKGRSLNVILLPVARDELLSGLLEGRGDIAAASLTITPARQKRVAFSDPTYPGIRELVVTGP
ncbi:MAG: transporter substrate-binding domain-containing protein, partial [Myxococcota bacterium]